MFWVRHKRTGEEFKVYGVDWNDVMEENMFLLWDGGWYWDWADDYEPCKGD